MGPEPATPSQLIAASIPTPAPTILVPVPIVEPRCIDCRAPLTKHEQNPECGGVCDRCFETRAW